MNVLNISRLTKNHSHLRGLTLLELLVVIAIVGLLAIVCVVQPARDIRTRATRFQCVNNLKQVGLDCMIWEGDHRGRFPMAVLETNGGTMELTAGPYAFRHFQVMSNELITPKLVLCPGETDRNRILAKNFSQFSNSNLSFFIGTTVTNECTPNMILSGDHNVTNGASIKNAVLNLTPNQPVGWTTEMHKNAGNIALADGSVQQVSRVGLQTLVDSPQITIDCNTSLTNGPAVARLQMPVLGQ